jgi:hypothetical protein
MSISIHTKGNFYSIFFNETLDLSYWGIDEWIWVLRLVTHLKKWSFPPDPLSLARVLPEEQAMTFHHATVQLLFLSAMAQGDIQPTTAFQTT